VGDGKTFLEAIADRRKLRGCRAIKHEQSLFAFHTISSPTTVIAFMNFTFQRQERNQSDIYSHNESFLRRYSYYINTAINDIKTHLYAFHGVLMETSELQLILSSGNTSQKFYVLEALQYHGWTSTCFLQLIEIHTSHGVLGDMKCLALSDRYRAFRGDLEALNSASNTLRGYRQSLVFAMTKAYYRLDLDELDELEIAEILSETEEHNKET
jgi:hypothetical protein